MCVLRIQNRPFFQIRLHIILCSCWDRQRLQGDLTPNSDGFGQDDPFNRRFAESSNMPVDEIVDRALEQKTGLVRNWTQRDFRESPRVGG